LHHSQCCQPAEISPAKHRSGPTKISEAEFSADLPKKMAEKGPNFFEVWFSHKILDKLKKKTSKSTELPDFFLITMPSESFLTSIKPFSIDQSVCGRIFSPAAEIFQEIWQKTLDRSWQHCS
jgi:hypothetical protein